MATFYDFHGSNNFGFSEEGSGLTPPTLRNSDGLEAQNVNKRILPIYFKLTLDSTQTDVQPYFLAMYVNPQSLSHQFRKKITRQKTLAGWAEFHWGDELIGLSAEGVTGAFLNQETWRIESAVNRGNTVAWKAFKSLLELYKNNGVVWTTGNASDGIKGNLLQGDEEPIANGVFQPVGYAAKVGELQLIYDHFVYSGYFESFEFSENADSPYMLTFNFSFKAYNRKDTFFENVGIPRQGGNTQSQVNR